MEVIKLKVPDVVTAIDMLESSLKREIFLLDKSIRDTKKKLMIFEEKNEMQSEDFLINSIIDNLFIITAYLTDTVKGGEILWEKR